MSTREEVLDEILKVLISIDRKDLVDAYMGEQPSKYSKVSEKKVKAKKKWKCIQCKRSINVGDQYVSVTHTSLKYMLTERYCLECKDKKEEKRKIESKINKKLRFMQHV